MSEKVRHILSLSGGKDSSALAVFMKGKVPEMEYVFCDSVMDVNAKQTPNDMYGAAKVSAHY